MALVTVQRSPTNSNSSSTISDNECETEEKIKKQCESFFAVKGAALVLPRSNESRPVKKNPIVGELSSHLQSMFLLLRNEDRMTIAVKLESMYEDRNRYITLVTTNGIQDTEESIVLGIDIMSNSATIGLVLPIWCETSIQLNGDGGFIMSSKNRTNTFKPVSVQALWSAMQAIHAGISTAQKHNYFPSGLNLTWTGYYESRISSSTSRIKEWSLMPELQVITPHAFTPKYSEEGHYYPSDRELTQQLIYVKIKDIMSIVDVDTVTSRQIRDKLEDMLGKDLRDYRQYLDEQLITYMRQLDSASLIFDHIYLGSEWNASHLAELEANGVGYILNITMEIDNFYPNRFIYHNVRLYDIESSELLKYWDESYRFLSKAKETGSKALVHCKMGISRSAATVIAYAMKEYNWPLEKARSFVKSKRKCVNPNEGFIQQLQVYEGMLDASRQRHNKLWRSKSENSLNCSQETAESISSVEGDDVDNDRGTSGTAAPRKLDLSSTAGTGVAKTTGAVKSPPGLAAHTGHVRRRSWSPKDTVADRYFPSCNQVEVGNIRRPSANVDFMQLDMPDDCEDIQIIVPERLTPTSPTLTVPTESILIRGSKDVLPLDGRPPSENSDVLALGRPNLVVSDAPMVGESPSEYKEGISDLLVTSVVDAPTADSAADSDLNTNNNSTTATAKCCPCEQERLSVGSDQEVLESVEGTVKLRVNSFENQQVNAEPDDECSSAEENVVGTPVEDVEIHSGTVQKQKQDIEERLKAKVPEKGSPPTARSGRITPEGLAAAKEADDPTASTAEILPVVEGNNDHGITSPPLPSSMSLLLQETTHASPTLQALETGRIKKITELLLSQSSPTKDLEEATVSSTPPADKPKGLDFEQVTPSRIPSSPVAPRLPPDPASGTHPETDTAVEEEPSCGSPRKEAFVVTHFGEEIPLEPGTVKRQIEQLSCHDDLAAARKEEAAAADAKREDEEHQREKNTQPKLPTELLREINRDDPKMVVIIRDSSPPNKRKLDEGSSQGASVKHVCIDHPSRDSEEVMDLEGDAAEDHAVVNSAYPDEGISWQVGDVRRHLQQFENRLGTPNEPDTTLKPLVDVAPAETSDTPLEEGTPYGQSTPTGSSIMDSGSSSDPESTGTVESELSPVDVDRSCSEVTEQQKLKEVEGLRERIEKLGLTSLRRTASIARISNERGSPVVLRRKDFTRPVSIRGERPRSLTVGGTRSLQSSPEGGVCSAVAAVENRRQSAHAKLVTPRVDSIPLAFYLEKPTSVEIRPLLPQAPGQTPVATDDGNLVGLDEPPPSSVTEQAAMQTGQKKQHGKSHPLSKLGLF